MFSCQRLVGWDLLLYGEATRLGNTILDNFKISMCSPCFLCTGPLAGGYRYIKHISREFEYDVAVYVSTSNSSDSSLLCLQHASCLSV